MIGGLYRKQGKLQEAVNMQLELSMLMPITMQLVMHLEIYWSILKLQDAERQFDSYDKADPSWRIWIRWAFRQAG